MPAVHVWTHETVSDSQDNIMYKGGADAHGWLGCIEDVTEQRTLGRRIQMLHEDLRHQTCLITLINLKGQTHDHFTMYCGSSKK